MKKSLLFLLTLISIIFTGCNDDPEIIFHDINGTYTINGDGLKMNVCIDGVTLRDTEAGVRILTKDNHIAQITLMSVVPGYGEVTVGGVVLDKIPSGEGVVFQGKYPLNESEMIVFQGTVINGQLTIDIQTIPIPTPQEQ